MTVLGLTITRAWRQPGHRQDRMTQKTLSAFRSNGRGLFRFRTATCCRRAGISVWSAARSAKISMILCMPERGSGGDAKFQGFCDGWNKWEGQDGRASAWRFGARIRRWREAADPIGGDASFEERGADSERKIERLAVARSATTMGATLTNQNKKRPIPRRVVAGTGP